MGNDFYQKKGNVPKNNNKPINETTHQEKQKKIDELTKKVEKLTNDNSELTEQLDTLKIEINKKNDSIETERKIVKNLLKLLGD